MNLRFRVIEHPPQTSSMNMAIDEALLRLIGDPVLRFYQWQEPAVSIGYFESKDDVPEGRPFVRRYTGGGLVDHARDFTYSVVLPRGHSLERAGTANSYELLHQGVSQALCQLGYISELASACGEEKSNACFEKPVKYDVLQGNRKLAGAAQRRSREGCLHQGSILLEADFDRKKLASALSNQFASLLGEPQRSSLTPDEILKANELNQSRYATEEWQNKR